MARIAALCIALVLAAVAQAAGTPGVAQILAATPQISQLRLGEVQSADDHRYVAGELVQPDPYGEAPLHTRFDLYLAGTRAAPLVLVLTPYRGETFADVGYARELARHGVHAAVIAVPKNAYRQEAGIEYINRFFVRHTVNVRALKHALRTHPDSPLEVRGVAVLGTSLGAIRASLLYGVDPEVKAAVLIVPGGDLANLIANTVLTPIARWRRKFLNPQSVLDPVAPPVEMTPEDLLAFERRLRPHIQVDPLDFVRPGGAADLLMVRSDGDTFVPRYNQDRLYRAYREASDRAPHEIPGSSLGHYATVISTYNGARDTLVAFLRQRLQP
jgi:dienelactone hydrolase